MTVQEAYKKIQVALAEKKTLLEDYGLSVKARTFYTDKNLAECHEFNAKCILVFGDMAIGLEELEDEEWCNYSVCAEIKTAEVSETELDDGISEWCKEIDNFIEKIKYATSVATVIKEITRIQEEEAEKAAAEFAKEMKKIRFKMIGGLAIIILLMLAVLIFVPMIG